MMSKKLNQSKSSIISQLTENMKPLIQSKLQNIIQEYKNQLQKVTYFDCSNASAVRDKLETGKLESSRKNRERKIERI